MNQKNPKVMFVLVILFSLSAVLGIGYWVVSAQQNDIRAKESEIEKIKQAQLSLKEDFAKVQNRQRKIIDQNRNFRDDAIKYSEQKKVILEQVRSSVAGFETFRVSATEEIAQLKRSVEALEATKKATEEKLHSVQMLSGEEKDKLTVELYELGLKIEQLRSTEAKMVANLNNKDRSSMAAETAKLHYNLGNFYFRESSYKNAAAEYRKVIFYRPDDEDANFNLAVVSDDYLDDRPTALFRYKRYLELRPFAVDHNEIRRRILDLELRDKVIDETVPKKKRDTFQHQDPAGLSNFRFIGDKR